MIVRDQPSIFKVLFSWRGTILPKILPSLGFVMLISAIIGGVEYVDLYRFPEIPLVGFTLIGVVLSIFLGFKNTACYDRWWEARKLWGVLIATSLIQNVIVFANVLRDRLRHQTANPTELTETSGLSQQALTQLYQQHNAPQYTLSLIQWELLQAMKEGEISDIIYTQMNRHVAALSEMQTGCDRIANTPIPFAYSVLLNRIDALSTEIEEPFGTQSNDLPLDAMVRSIEIELLGTLGRPTPPPIQAQDHNLL